MKVPMSSWSMLILAIVAIAGCHTPRGHNLPPSERLLQPGPGVGGPGPGVLMPPQQVLSPEMMGMPAPTSQVNFSKPTSTQVRWVVSEDGSFDSVPLVVPGRHNFPQGGIYRLKLTNIPGREGVELYPTLEVGPTTARTGAFLAHNAIPVQFEESDFDQVLSGNFVTKVIYLPDPEFQGLTSGVETLVSTRLADGIDPIVEADQRGSIMAIVRLGNKDIEMEGSGDAASVMAVGYHMGVMGPNGQPMPISMPPSYVAGVTAPQYGMPMTGTPIGLPGPPHIPLGGPAGLQKHVMKNHTSMHLPQPTKKMRIDVKQRPGLSYPQPASRARITESSVHAGPHFYQSMQNRFQAAP